MPEASDVQTPSTGTTTSSTSGPGRRLWARWWFWIALLGLLGILISVFADTAMITTWMALLLGFVIIRTGLFLLQSFATPPPPPPDPGTLRKVKLVYRCNVCGTEVRMTAADSEDPDPPRHCMDEMQLVTPVE